MVRFFKTDFQGKKVAGILEEYGYKFVNYASDQDGDELSFSGTKNAYVNLRFSKEEGFYVQTIESKVFNIDIDKLRNETDEAQFLYNWIMEVLQGKYGK